MPCPFVAPSSQCKADRRGLWPEIPELRLDSVVCLLAHHHITMLMYRLGPEQGSVINGGSTRLEMNLRFGPS